MDVAPYFVDPDGDMLTYAAVSSDVGVMSASISGSTLTLAPVGAGAAMVSVQATDPGGLTATQQIAVTVKEPAAQSAPDLLVGSPSVDDSSPETGGSFTLSATVRNDGDGASPATTLRYYRSTNATITASDTEVGTDAVGPLSASGTSEESIDLTASATAGTYYYGACVEAVSGESDTTNNCSAAVQVDVEEPVYPDLQVGSPSVNDGSPETEGSFTLSATVTNSGDAEAAATTLRYYRSTDATITSSDTQVGTDAVDALSASGTSAESIDLTASATAGTYYYGACVDAVTGESSTTNNCSSAVSVTVSAPPPPPPQVNPDLVVASSVNDNSPTTEGSFTLSATVTNSGDAEAAATTLRYYRSTDATITSSDTQVGTDAVDALSASGTSAESIDLTASATAGTYYYGACVDAVTGESSTTNNCSSAVSVTVSAPPPPPPQVNPDLVVASSVNDNSPTTEGSFTLSATVTNSGDAEAVATTLRYYRSTDATITSSDTQVGTDAVDALSASGTSAESIDLTASATAGTYYYGACVDAVTGESSTTNNCSSAVSVTVSAPPPPPPQVNPDLVVASSVNDNSLETGGSFTLSVAVTNAGDRESPATTLRYYRSTDATITASDTQVGTDAVGVLSVLGTSAESIDLTAPSTAGTYYYGACVDAVAGESDTTNNCSAAVPVDVEEPVYPDLEVGTPSVNDSSPETGGSFTLSATVTNVGDGESPATTLRYYRSADATITTSDTQVGTGTVGVLSASGTSAESIDLAAPSTPGRYYYGACVDAVADESDTTDNCSGSVQVGVEEPVYPDLEVGSPSVDDSSPETGGSFTLSATVTNGGDRESPATTLRYYRSTDATISSSDTEVGTDAVGALSASGTSAESIDLTAPSTAGRYYYGACVEAVSGESDTTNNCSTSVQVDVETPQPQQTPASVEVTAPQEWAPVGETVTYTAQRL